MAAVKLNDVVDVALADHWAHAEAADVKVEYIEAASPVHTWGNFEQLVHVVSHLLGNALLHTPRGGQVWVKLYQDADDALLQVQDTGLKRDVGRYLHADRAGHSHDQAHETTECHSTAQANRALAAVAESIQRLGGHIEADSQMEEGSTLTVRLPRLQAAQLTGSHRFKPAS